MLHFRLAVGCLLSVSCGVAHSAVLTPEQAVKSRNISGLTFSPDGARLACVVSDPPKGGPPESHIWMLDVPRQEFRQITFSSKSENSPRWSPDGRTLAFLSNRDERMQIYLLRIDGGEASPLTSGKNAAGEFRWSPDGKQIAFLAPEPKSDAEEKKEKDKDDGKVADREQDLQRLWVVDLASKKVRQVTRGEWRIEDFDWISGDRVVAVATNEPKAETWNTALFNVSVADGKISAFAQPSQPFGGLTVSPDRAHLSYVAPRRAGPEPYDLFFESTAGGAARDMTASIDRPVLGVKWQNNNTAIISVADEFRYRLYRVSTAETAPKRIELPYSNGDFGVARDGTIAFVAFAFNRLPELFMQPLRARPSRSAMCRKAGAASLSPMPICSVIRVSTEWKFKRRS